jgi:hypothetical protein
LRAIFSQSRLASILLAIMGTSALLFGVKLGPLNNTPSTPATNTQASQTTGNAAAAQDTPTPAAPTNSAPANGPTSGVWNGQGSFRIGQTGFPMTLTLNVNGTTFSGDLAENTLNSEATINGGISSSFTNGVGITFKPSQVISGGQILSGTIYTASIINGQMRGQWSLPGTRSHDGTFTLTPMPTPTPAANQPPGGTTPNQPNGGTAANTFTTGKWQGERTFLNGQNPDPMVLTVTVNQNTFSGNLTENAGQSQVVINGTITNTTANGVEIVFTDNLAPIGKDPCLGCTYTATVSNKQMKGSWFAPGNPAPQGTIKLTQTL